MLKIAKITDGVKVAEKTLAEGSNITLTEDDGTVTISASGGSGLTIKSGSTTTNGSGEAAVSFNTEFPDTNYAIILTALSGTDTVSAMYNSKAVGGFSIKTENDQGNAEASVTVDWVAIEYSNP